MADRRRRSPKGSSNTNNRRRADPRANYDEPPRMRATGAETYAPYSSSSSSSSSTSIIDISRSYPPNRSGLKTFFTTPSERRRLRKRRSSRLLKGNHSSSSDLDLAYGQGYLKRPKLRRVRSRTGRQIDREKYGEKYNERHSDRDGGQVRHGEKGRESTGSGHASVLGKVGTTAEILAVGAGIAKLAREQNKKDLRDARNGKRPEMAAVRDSNGNFYTESRGLGPSKHSHGPDEDGWESASDSESSVDSRLAFGNDNKGGWSFFGKKEYTPMSRKSSVVDPRLFGRQNSLRGVITQPVGFGEVAWTSTSDFGQHEDASRREASRPEMSQREMAEREASQREISQRQSHRDSYTVAPNQSYNESQSQVSLQQLPPMPMSEVDSRDARYATESQPYITSRPDPVPIQLQHPKPFTPVSQSVYEPIYPSKSEGGGTMKRTTSSSGRSKSLAGAAIAGVAGAAMGGMIASSRDDRKDKQREEELDALERERLRRRESEKKDSDKRDSKDDRRRDKRASSPEQKKDKRRDKESKEDTEERRRDKKRDDRRDETRSEKGDRRDDTRSEKGDRRDETRSEGGKRDETRSEKGDRREKRREDRRAAEIVDERFDTSRRTKSEAAVSTTSVDPFQFQVAPNAFPTPTVESAPNHRRIDSVPTVVTVDREPKFTRNRSSSIKGQSIVSSSSKPEDRQEYFDTQKEYPDRRRDQSGWDEKEQRYRGRDSKDRVLYDAESTVEDAKHFTGPYDAAVVTAVVAAEHHRETRAEERRRERQADTNYDGYESRSRDTAPERDLIQEEADRAYREIVMARKIASNVIRSRTPSPNRSVVRKYETEEKDEPEIIRIVTPPGMDDHKKKGPYDAPNADFRLDHVLEHPRDLQTFNVPSINQNRSTSQDPYLYRDPDASAPRPLLNLVYPTPAPSPMPERQVARSEPARADKSQDRKTPKRTSSADVVIGPKGNVIASPTASNVSKGVTWGQNETKHYEVESPSEHRDEFVSNADIQSRGTPVENQPSVVPKGKGWGAVAAGIIGVGAGAAVSETTKNSKSQEPVRKEAPYEYRGIVVEPESPPRKQRQRSPPSPGPKPVSSQTARTSHMPGGFDDDLDFTATVAAGLQDTGFDPNIVIDDPTFRRRDSPPGSNETRFYQSPSAETVTDLGMNPSEISRTRGTEGFIIGEVASTPKDWPTVSPPAADEKLSKKELKKREKASKRQSIEITPLEDTPTTREVEDEVSSYFPPLSKKEQKKRDKAAQRQSSQGDDATPFSEPSAAAEIVAEPESYFEAPKSSKKSKKGSSAYEESTSEPSRESRTVSVSVNAFDDLQNGEDEWAESSKKSKKKSKRNSDRFDSPIRSMSPDVAPETSSAKLAKEHDRYESPARSAPSSEISSSGKKSKDKSSRRFDGYEYEPTEVSLPASTPSETSRDGEYEDARSSRKSSIRDSSVYKSEDRGEPRSVVGADSREEEPESRKKKKKSSRSVVGDYDDDTRSVASAPAGGDFEDSKLSKKKKDKKSSGIFSGLFGSRSESGARDESPKGAKDDFEEAKKSKKSKRHSMPDASSLYGDLGAASVGDLSQVGSNGYSNGNGKYADDMDDGVRSDGEKRKKSRSRSDSASSKKDSFLGKAGTHGAGVGIAITAAAIAAQQYSQSKAKHATNKATLDPAPTRGLEESSTRDELLDPEITQRQFRPSIDPQYGDLLPLPPSDPASPNVEPVDDLPGLPDSRPTTPEAERLAREKTLNAVRRSLLDTPMKSPSQSQVPLKFKMGNRSIPSSPGAVRSSPMQSPANFSQESLTFPRHRSRPTSWDNTKEFKPLYLVESTRRGSIGQSQVDAEQLPELPLSQRTSRSSSQIDFTDAEHSVGGSYSDTHPRGLDPLSIDTGLASSSTAGELLDSGQSTPKANLSRSLDDIPRSSEHSMPEQSSILGGDALKAAGAAGLISTIGYFASTPSHPATKESWLDDLPSATPLEPRVTDLPTSSREFSLTDDQRTIEGQPSAVDPMSKNRSSYLMKSSPMSRKYEDDEPIDRASITPTKNKSSADIDALHNIQEREGSDIFASSDVPRAAQQDREAALETLSGTHEDLQLSAPTTKKAGKGKKKSKGLSRSSTQNDYELPEPSTQSTPNAAADVETEPSDEFFTKKSKKKDKKKKKTSLAGEGSDEQNAEVTPDLGRDVPEEVARGEPVNIEDESMERISGDTSSQQLENDAAKPVSVFDFQELSSPLQTREDRIREGGTVPNSEAVSRDVPTDDLQMDDFSTPSSSKKSKKNKRNSKSALAWEAEETSLPATSQPSTDLIPDEASIRERGQDVSVSEPVSHSLPADDVQTDDFSTPSSGKKSKKNKRNSKSAPAWEAEESSLPVFQQLSNDLIPDEALNPIEEEAADEVFVVKKSKKDKKKNRDKDESTAWDEGAQSSLQAPALQADFSRDASGETTATDDVAQLEDFSTAKSKKAKKGKKGKTAISWGPEVDASTIQALLDTRHAEETPESALDATRIVADVLPSSSMHDTHLAGAIPTEEGDNSTSTMELGKHSVHDFEPHTSNLVSNPVPGSEYVHQQTRDFEISTEPAVHTPPFDLPEEPSTPAEEDLFQSKKSKKKKGKSAILWEPEEAASSHEVQPEIEPELVQDAPPADDFGFAQTKKSKKKQNKAALTWKQDEVVTPAPKDPGQLDDADFVSSKKGKKKNKKLQAFEDEPQAIQDQESPLEYDANRSLEPTEEQPSSMSKKSKQKQKPSQQVDDMSIVDQSNPVDASLSGPETPQPTPMGGPGAWPITPSTPFTSGEQPSGEVPKPASKSYFPAAAAAMGAMIFGKKSVKQESTSRGEDMAAETTVPQPAHSDDAQSPSMETESKPIPDGLAAGYDNDQLTLAKQMQEEFASKSKKKDKKKRQSLPATPPAVASRSVSFEDPAESHSRARSLSLEPAADRSSLSPASGERKNVYSEEQLELARQLKADFASGSKKDKRGRKGTSRTLTEDEDVFHQSFEQPQTIEPSLDQQVESFEAPDGLDAGYQEDQLSLARQLQAEFGSGSKKSSKKGKKSRSTSSTPQELEQDPDYFGNQDRSREASPRNESLDQPKATTPTDEPVRDGLAVGYTAEQLEVARKMKEDFSSGSKKSRKRGTLSRSNTEEDFSDDKPVADVDNQDSPKGSQPGDLTASFSAEDDFFPAASKSKKKGSKKREKLARSVTHDDSPDDLAKQDEALHTGSDEIPVEIADALPATSEDDWGSSKKSKKNKKKSQSVTAFEDVPDHAREETQLDSIVDLSTADVPASSSTPIDLGAPADEDFGFSSKKSKKDKKKKRGSLLRNESFVDDDEPSSTGHSQQPGPSGYDGQETLGPINEVPAVHEHQDDQQTTSSELKDREQDTDLVRDASPAVVEEPNSASASQDISRDFDDPELATRPSEPENSEPVFSVFAPVVKKSKKTKKDKKQVDNFAWADPTKAVTTSEPGAMVEPAPSPLIVPESSFEDNQPRDLDTMPIATPQDTTPQEIIEEPVDSWNAFPSKKDKKKKIKRNNSLSADPEAPTTPVDSVLKRSEDPAQIALPVPSTPEVDLLDDQNLERGLNPMQDAVVQKDAEDPVEEWALPSKKGKKSKKVRTSGSSTPTAESEAVSLPSQPAIEEPSQIPLPIASTDENSALIGQALERELDNSRDQANVEEPVDDWALPSKKGKKSRKAKSGGKDSFTDTTEPEATILPSQSVMEEPSQSRLPTSSAVEDDVLAGRDLEGNLETSRDPSSVEEPSDEWALPSKKGKKSKKVKSSGNDLSNLVTEPESVPTESPFAMEAPSQIPLPMATTAEDLVLDGQNTEQDIDAPQLEAEQASVEEPADEWSAFSIKKTKGKKKNKQGLTRTDSAEAPALSTPLEPLIEPVTTRDISNLPTEVATTDDPSSKLQDDMSVDVAPVSTEDLEAPADDWNSFSTKKSKKKSKKSDKPEPIEQQYLDPATESSSQFLDDQHTTSDAQDPVAPQDAWALPSSKKSKKDKKGKKSGLSTPTEEPLDPVEERSAEPVPDSTSELPDDHTTITAQEPATALEDWASPSTKKSKKDKRGKKSGVSTPVEETMDPIAQMEERSIEPAAESSSQWQDGQTSTGQDTAVLEDDWALPSTKKSKKDKKGKKSGISTPVEEPLDPEEHRSTEPTLESSSQRQDDQIANTEQDAVVPQEQDDWALPSTKKSKKDKKGKKSGHSAPIEELGTVDQRSVEPATNSNSQWQDDQIANTEQDAVVPQEQDDWALPSTKKSKKDKKSKKSGFSTPDEEPPAPVLEQKLFDDLNQPPTPEAVLHSSTEQNDRIASDKQHAPPAPGDDHTVHEDDDNQISVAAAESMDPTRRVSDPKILTEESLPAKPEQSIEEPTQASLPAFDTMAKEADGAQRDLVKDVDEKQDDDWSAFPIKKSKNNKGKKSGISTPVEESRSTEQDRQSEQEPGFNDPMDKGVEPIDPTMEPEPASDVQADDWSSFVKPSKKDKKKRKSGLSTPAEEVLAPIIETPTIAPEQPSSTAMRTLDDPTPDEPARTVEADDFVDDQAFIFKSKKDKKKTKKSGLATPEPANLAPPLEQVGPAEQSTLPLDSALETPTEPAEHSMIETEAGEPDDNWGSFVTKKSKKSKNRKSGLSIPLEELPTVIDPGPSSATDIQHHGDDIERSGELVTEETVEPDNNWGSFATKKTKKSKKAKSGVSTPIEELTPAVDPEPSSARAFEGDDFGGVEEPKAEGIVEPDDNWGSVSIKKSKMSKNRKSGLSTPTEEPLPFQDLESSLTTAVEGYEDDSGRPAKPSGNQTRDIIQEQEIVEDDPEKHMEHESHETQTAMQDSPAPESQDKVLEFESSLPNTVDILDEDPQADAFAFTSKKSKKDKKSKKASRANSESGPTSTEFNASTPVHADAPPAAPAVENLVASPISFERDMPATAEKSGLEAFGTDTNIDGQEEQDVYEKVSRKASKKDKRKRQGTTDVAIGDDAGPTNPLQTSWADEVEEAAVERDVPVIQEIAKDESLSHIAPTIESKPADDFVRPNKKGKKNSKRNSVSSGSTSVADPVAKELGQTETLAAISGLIASTGLVGSALASQSNAPTSKTDVPRPVTPTRKLSKKDKKKKSIDRRVPQDDIFDDPALWEGADPKVHGEARNLDDDSDGFWSPPKDEAEVDLREAVLEDDNVQPAHTEIVRSTSPAFFAEPERYTEDVSPTHKQASPTYTAHFSSNLGTPRDQIPKDSTRQVDDAVDEFVATSSKKDRKKKKQSGMDPEPPIEPARAMDTAPPAEHSIASPSAVHDPFQDSITPFDQQPEVSRQHTLASPRSFSEPHHSRIDEPYQERSLENYQLSPHSRSPNFPRLSLPVVHEEASEWDSHHERGTHDEDINRDSAFVTGSPVPLQRGFVDSYEHVRDSGVHLRDASPADTTRAHVRSSDDALARLSWPSVDDESETVDLRRSQRPTTEQRSDDRRSPLSQDSVRHAGDSVDLHQSRRSAPHHNDDITSRDLLPSQKHKTESHTDLHRTPTIHGARPSEGQSLVKQRLQQFQSAELPRPQKPKEDRSLTDLRSTRSSERLKSERSKEDKYAELTSSSRPQAEKPRGIGEIDAGAAAAGAALGFAAARKLSQEKRPSSAQSQKASPNINRLRTPDIHRPDSATSDRSGTPPLRRSDRKSGDLRSLSQRSKPDLAKEAELASFATPTPAVNSNPTANEGRARAKDMADVYDGFGEGRMGSPRSPTRPHSMRRRQSMQVLDLEQKLEQLAAENRLLSEAKAQADRALQSSGHPPSLVEKDAEIDSLKRTLEWLHNEVSRLTEVNDGLTSANMTIARQHGDRYGTLESQHAQASRELQEVRDAHENLAAGMDGVVRNEVQSAVSQKDLEIAQLRAELDAAKDQIRDMQRQILASKANDVEFLTIRDEDYFDNACQQLCQHVQQWVLRFSKFSDMRACRLTSEINNDKTIDRLDNAILDGSDVDSYLADRVKRRDVFMSMTMTMVWEFVFTRYLFGMDREQRQKLKSLEKTLSEVGPAAAVHQWRATTLTLLAKREAFAQQREQDTEAVVHAVMETLSEILPPPSHLEAQIEEQLTRVMKAAVDLSVEMRCQRAEYMMLPPLQPEYDANGDLASKVSFNAALMNERSGDTVSNEELEAQKAVVRIVLFPLVVKKGDDSGEGDEEIVVCPAQVLVAKPKKSVRISEMGQGNHSRVSMQSSMPADMGDNSMI